VEFFDAPIVYNALGDMRLGGERMDQQPVKDMASASAAKTSEAATDAVNQASAGVQTVLDRGKAAIEQIQEGAAGLGRQASEAGRQAMSQAGETMQSFSGDRASEMASNLYQQGVSASSHISRFAAEQPLAALLIAGIVGYGLAYLIHRP
jgi:triphosphoribosyl-dephospho-CoA synthetase